MLRSTVLPALVVLALVAGCGQRAPAGPAKRVILITCDTLRADRLGCYGYARPTSPHIDALAREGTLFEQAWSAAPLTGPALSSLHTGRYPEEAGGAPTNRHLLPEEAVTLAEVARAQGVATAAFVSNGVLRRPPAHQGDVGLQQGFDVYDDAMADVEANRDLLERRAADCTDAVLRWLAQRKADEPFFLWVHYQDPHGPYTPPAEHLAPFAREHPAEPVLPAGRTQSGLNQIPHYQVLGEERRPGPYADRYDGEVRYFDTELGRLLDGLRARGLYDDALIVFTADHGESLGEHGYWFCHGETLQAELLRVPLVVRYPDALRRAALPQGASAPMGGAARVATPVSHLDLWPTVVAALGLEAETNRGVSLLGAAVPEGRVLAQFRGVLNNPARMLAVTDGRWRVILNGAQAPLLYDLAADPGETRDVAAANRAELARMQQRYVAMMESDPRPWLKPVVFEVDERGRRVLQGLGYTDGADGHEEH